MAEDIIADRIPTQEQQEKRFLFIKNDILRTNIVLAFRYIIFLIQLTEDYKLPGSISYSIYKNIVLYTASIVESCIHYCIDEYLKAGLVRENKIMPSDWSIKECKELHLISKNRRVCGVIQEIKIEKFAHNTNFIILNRAARKANILTEKLCKDADILRTQRNNIHLAGLTNVDDFYEKKHIESAFESARKLIDHIEKKLNKLSK